MTLQDPDLEIGDPSKTHWLICCSRQIEITQLEDVQLLEVPRSGLSATTSDVGQHLRRRRYG